MAFDHRVASLSTLLLSSVEVPTGILIHVFRNRLLGFFNIIAGD